MAIRRLDPNAVKKVVSAMDEAVDIEKSNMQLYAQSLDMKHIVLKPELKPTYFLIKNIDPISELKITEAHQRITPPGKDKDGVAFKAKVEFIDQGQMSLKYFEHCVRNVEEDGKILPIEPAQFSLTIIQEIGSYAMLWSKVGENLKKT